MTAMQENSLIAGRVIKLGDHIDTDLIYPGKYVPISDPDEWAKHALEGLDPSFPSCIQQDDILVAGRNFGCGSSRSQAVSCLKLAGIQAIVAGSFARIFYRNAINQGLPVITCPEAIPSIQDKRVVSIDLNAGKIELDDRQFFFPPLPDFLLKIIYDGGLIEHTKNTIHQRHE